MIHPFIYKKTTTIQDLAKALDEQGQGILPIIENNGKFVGIITDGDLRRAILSDKKLIDDIVNTKPHTKLDSSSDAEIALELKKLKRRHMPVLSKTGDYVKIVSLDSFNYNIKTNPVVLMAGGLGSRLGELTKTTPKPMLQVGGIPILERVINKFKEHEFVNFYISVSYLSDQIINYFGDGSKLGVSIKYIHETKRMGTAGSLTLIEDDFTEPFFVMNSDLITDLNFSDLLAYHKNKNSIATMCTVPQSDTIPFGVVESTSNGFITSLKEKPTYHWEINAGIYVLDPKVLSRIDKDVFFDMPSLFEIFLKADENVFKYLINSEWYDIGNINDYNTVCELFTNEK